MSLKRVASNAAFYMIGISCAPRHVLLATILANYRHETETNEATAMLAEKFFLVLETIMSRPSPDGDAIVVSASRHVPIKLPSASRK